MCHQTQGHARKRSLGRGREMLSYTENPVSPEVTRGSQVETGHGQCWLASAVPGWPGISGSPAELPCSLPIRPPLHPTGFPLTAGTQDQVAGWVSFTGSCTAAAGHRPRSWVTGELLPHSERGQVCRVPSCLYPKHPGVPRTERTTRELEWGGVYGRCTPDTHSLRVRDEPPS